MASFFSKLFGKKKKAVAPIVNYSAPEKKEETPAENEDAEVLREFDPEVACYAPVGPYSESEATRGLSYKSKEYYDAYIVTGRGSSEDKTIIVPESVGGHVVVSIGDEAFKDDNELTKIIISEGVKYIEGSAFKNCRNLTEVKLPTTIVIIDPCAFEGCSNLKEITLPKKLTEIKYSTFENCYKLETVRMPERLEKLGFSAFSDCGALKNITIPEGLTTIARGVFSRSATYADEVVIPDGVVTIEDYAFAESGFGKVYLPSTVKKIGEQCFSSAVEAIIYDGTIAEFGEIELHENWKDDLKIFSVKCKDGLATI